jgi:hypothetical protein
MDVSRNICNSKVYGIIKSLHQRIKKYFQEKTSKNRPIAERQENWKMKGKP